MAESTLSLTTPTTDATVDARLSGGMNPGRSSVRRVVESLMEQGVDAAPESPLCVDVRLGDAALKESVVRQIGRGDVIEFDQMVTDPVDVCVNQQLVARGCLVRVNGRYGVRIEELVEH